MLQYQVLEKAAAHIAKYAPEWDNSWELKPTSRLTCVRAATNLTF